MVLPSHRHSPAGLQRKPIIRLRVLLDTADPHLVTRPGMVEWDADMHITASTALFGADLSALPPSEEIDPLRSWRGTGVRILKNDEDRLGCSTYKGDLAGGAVLVWRGGCTFLEKLVYARDAGASGVVVVSDDDKVVNPSATPEEIAAVGGLDDVALVLVPSTSGMGLAAVVDGAGVLGYEQVYLSLDLKEDARPDGDPDEHRRGQLLYVNNRPLLNSRLLV